jgi:hypothetical protein
MGTDLRDQRCGNIRHAVIFPGMFCDLAEDFFFVVTLKASFATWYDVTTTKLFHFDDLLARLTL